MGQGKLRVLALRDGDRLVAVMPCAEQRDSSHARWAPLGEGQSDYLDGTFAAGFEQPALEAVLDWLDRAGYNRFEVTDLHQRSGLLTAHCPAGWQTEESLHNVCPVVTLPRPGRICGKRYLRGNLETFGTIGRARETSVKYISSALLRKRFRRYSANFSCCTVLAGPSAARPEFSLMQSWSNFISRPRERFSSEKCCVFTSSM